MRKNYLMFLGIVLIGLVYAGCSSVGANVESAFSFAAPIPTDKLIVGSFTYNINDTFIIGTNDSIFVEPNSSAREQHEAYHRVEYTDRNGVARSQLRMKDGYKIASYDELYLWAIKNAAKSAGITSIFAIKSFITTSTTSAAGVTVARQDVTITVFGESE